MGYRPPNPEVVNILLDSCAFDPKYGPEDVASAEIFRWCEESRLTLMIAHSTQKEIEHPNTPSWVKHEASYRVPTMPTELNQDERHQLQAILETLAGNGVPENFTQDAQNVFEAGKYGPYFVTTDKRILNKAAQLHDLCGALVVKPSRLLEIREMYKVA